MSVWELLLTKALTPQCSGQDDPKRYRNAKLSHTHGNKNRQDGIYGYFYISSVPLDEINDRLLCIVVSTLLKGFP